MARLEQTWVNLGFRVAGGVRPEVHDLPDEAVAKCLAGGPQGLP